MVLGLWRPWKAVVQRGRLHWLGGALADKADDEVLLVNDTVIATLEEACRKNYYHSQSVHSTHSAVF